MKPVGGIGSGAMAVPIGGGGAGQGRERSIACSKAAMASSQLVMLSSGFHVLPAASRPVQSTRTYAALPAVAHLKLEQLLHFLLGHAVQARRWRWWAGTRVAAEAVRSSEVWAQAFDVELGEVALSRGYVEPVRAWRSAREDPEGAHPPRGEQRSRREGLVLRL